MNTADFLVELEDILQREEPCDINDSLDDYEEWDSLSKMSVMAYYSKNFNTQLSMNSFDDIHTVSDLIKLAGTNVQ